VKNPHLKIGLALGSGSARGWAHIGVIEVLQQAGIPIHCIAGCSIGSVVGAIYSAGSLPQFSQWVRGLNRRNMAQLIDISFSGGGVMSGKKLMHFLKQFNLDQSIESLPIKFASVSTDLHTGREIWLTEGDLSLAIRSSISLPGLFQPVDYHDAWLVDGGLVNPVPVSLCRAMGADIVIGVNLNHDLMQPRKVLAPDASKDGLNIESWLKKLIGWDERPGYYSVLSQSIKIMQDRITKARAGGDPADISIEPLLADFSLYDFHKADGAIREGMEATQRQLALITKIIELCQH
jgi:NTE family protein